MALLSTLRGLRPVGSAAVGVHATPMTATGVEEQATAPAPPITASRRARRGVTPAEWLGLLAGLTPLLIAVARAIGTRCVPPYDAGYFSTRSLDVLTEHHPFVGAWSTFSFVTGDPFNNLGPLQLLTMAPFTRLDPFAGGAVAVALVNALAVVATWAAARRLFGPRGVVAVMGATVVLIACFGQLAWIDARQQLALLLPFWAFAWLTIVTVRPASGWLPLAWVAAGSLVLQTHFSYAYSALTLVAVGTIGFVVVNRHPARRRKAALVLASSVGLAALLWAHTLWDELAGAGNLSAVARHAGGDRPAGSAVAASILVDGPLSPPFWWPGSVARFHPPWSDRPGVLALLTLAAWIAALLAVFVRTAHRAPALCAAAGVSLVLLITTWITAARISGALPQNYFALWPASLLAAVVLVGAVAPARPLRSVRAEPAAAVTFVVALLLVPFGLEFPSWDLPSALTGARARQVLDDVGDRLDELVDRGLIEPGEAVVVDEVTDRILMPDYYNTLSVLRDRGLDLHFVAGSDDLQRFGTARCEDGDERWRLQLSVGAPRPAAPGEVLLGARSGLRPDEREELGTLQRQLEAAFHDGRFAVDLDRADDLGVAGDRLRRAAGEPGALHFDLASSLDLAVEAGAADVPPALRRAYARWTDLATALFVATWRVSLVPNDDPGPGCADS